MTVPKGLPAWSRAADHTYYGGDVNKQNYLSQGAIDPLTDFSAEDLTRMAADLSAAIRTVPFAVITYTADDSTPADPTVTSVKMMTGVQTVSYNGGSPPSGFPAVTRVADGVTRIVFGSSYADDYAVSSSFDATDVVPTALATTSVNATANVVDGQTIDVYTWVSSSGAAATNASVSVEIW